MNPPTPPSLSEVLPLLGLMLIGVDVGRFSWAMCCSAVGSGSPLHSGSTVW